MKESVKTVVALSVLLMATSITVAGGILDYLPAWTSVASGCSLNPSQAALAEYSGPDVRYSKSNTSPPGLGGVPVALALNCNVINPIDGNPKWSYLYVGYEDPDGQGTDYRILATLYGEPRSGQPQFEVAKFDSNKYADTSRHEMYTRFNTTWDFIHNDYYVAIWIFRTKSLASPGVYEVRLAYGVPAP